MNPIDVATALLVIFVRRFFNQIPFAEVAILNAPSSQISLYRPLSFVAGGLLYYITRTRHSEWLNISRDFSRRRLLMPLTRYLAQSQIRVADRVRKAKACTAKTFQGTYDLQRRSRLCLEHCFERGKAPLVLQNHAVSRFVPNARSRSSFSNTSSDPYPHFQPSTPVVPKKHQPCTGKKTKLLTNDSEMGPRFVAHCGNGDAPIEIIRTTRSGKIYGYRRFVRRKRKPRNRR